MMKKNHGAIASSNLQRFSVVRRRLSKQKLAIIGLWFLILTAIRILFAYFLKDIWIGTFGAVGLTFAVFYLLIRYTPLQRYRPKINAIFSQWIRRKYFIISTITISAILVSLLVLIQFGYSYYGTRLVRINIFQVDDKELDKDLVLVQTYPFVDKVAIIVASIDKSLNGNYARTISFMLAEDMEMTLFVLLARRNNNNMFAI
jgi:hypothetical protein